jgi:hypothetical protein
MSQRPQFVFGWWVFFSWIVRNAWDKTDTRTVLQNKKVQNIVNMPCCQQADRFARLFFNIFNGMNRLLKLVQKLRGKVKREFPLFSRFTRTSTSLWARSLTRPVFWLTLSSVRLRNIRWAGEKPGRRGIRDFCHEVGEQPTYRWRGRPLTTTRFDGGSKTFQIGE